MNFSDLALPFGAGRRLILAGVRLGGLWIAAGVAALVLILMLYRYERRLVSRRTGLVLLSLRVLAVLALIAALFEPIAQRSFRETIRGRVILGADLSESMTTADPNRSSEERQKLAAALKMKPEESSAPTRREIVRRLVSGDWLDSIARAHDLEALGFARDAIGDGSTTSLRQAVKTPPKPDDPAALTTDWGPALERALKEKDGAPVVGVVLLTDGRQNGPEHPELSADKLAARGIPVFPVLIGTNRPPRDAAIASIKAAERVSRGDAADVEVTLKLDGPAAGTEVPVSLEHAGGPAIKKTTRVAEDGSRPVVTFRVPMERVGSQALTVAVGPIDDDARPDNDRRTAVVEVTDDRAKVLLVDGEPRWEFQYLRNALLRDPHVTLDAIVLHQPPRTGATENAYPAALPPRPADLSGQTPDPLNSYDVIIFGDIIPADLSAESWSRLESYVDGRGGTLILSAGPRSWPALSAHEVARRLLPVLDPRPAAPSTQSIAEQTALPPGVAIAPNPTATADAWPMLRFAAEPERSRAAWAALPRLPFALAARPKPLATVLASLADDAKSETSAVIAAQPYGLGKVLWIGTDATWRWRYRAGDIYHHRFWGQAIRWANAAKLAAGNRLVRFGPLRPRVVEGQAVAIRAQFSDDAPALGPDSLLAARVFKAGPTSDADGPTPLGDPVAVIPLRPRPDQPRTFESEAPSLPAGSYVVRLDVPSLAEPLRVGAPLEIVARPTPERIELAANRDPLDRLASATGGQVLADYEADRLPGLLRARTLEKVRTEETSLWDRPAALVVFFAILTVEWVLRKRAGLP